MTVVRSPYVMPPFATATEWGNVWQSMFKRIHDARTPGKAPDGTAVPRLTNREAMAVIRGWRSAAMAAGQKWPLWYQFAAVVYAWDPRTDVLDVAASRADELYPVATTHELWLASYELANTLDQLHVKSPRVDLDPAAFGDPVNQGAVKAALLQDGASAQWKIPVPSCKDKNGKPTGKPTRGKDGKWRCEPVLVDDPITHSEKSIAGLVAILAIGWLVLSGDRSPRRRRRTT